MVRRLPVMRLSMVVQRCLDLKAAAIRERDAQIAALTAEVARLKHGGGAGAPEASL